MIIYDKAGSILLDIEVDDTSVRYKAIKGENSLTLKFSLAEHVEVPLGSYCVFKGETYILMMPEDLTMNHRRSFEYTLVMYGEDAIAKRYVFVNPVDGRFKFSLTAKPVEHLQMFVDNMNMRDAGWSVGECPDHVEIVLSYNSTKCHDALVQLADELELDYWFNGKVVNIGKLELNKDNPLPLSYGGDGEGLKPNVKRTNYSDALPIEVLFVQGTETNIDASKYGASELHLPKGKIIKFDGTFFEDEEGFDESKARSYKTDENGYSVTRADKEIVNHSEDSLDCSDIEPTKEEAVSSVVEVNKEKHFYDILFASDVDYSKYVIGGENATVVFQSGMLAGKEFDLATDSNGNLICKKEEDLWRVEIVPQDIDGITMPDIESGYVPVADDTFKVFGIQLPDEYMHEAEMNMLRYAIKHFYSNEDVQYTVSGELDEIYAKRNWDSIKDKLALGSYISFSDKSFQEEPLLIRITGIKDYVNKPYSPQLEISNAVLSGTLVGTLNRIENQEVETEDKIRQAIGFSKRKWRDAKETISMLNSALTNFSEGISPVTVETMTMLVGDERLQFVFTESLTSDVVSELMYNYDVSTGTFSVQSGFIKHMTLGIDSISPVHAKDEYKRWSVAEVSEALDRESGYYLYAKVSKDSTSGAFELHDTIQTDTEEWYYLLVGILNSEYDGDRSFASMYGYTEVRPGQITTDSIRSSDSKTWLDLLKGILYLNNMAGVSGVKTDEKGDQSIAAWFGGLMIDAELDDDKENAAKSVIRHDGTGYFADGLFKWDKDKGVDLGNGAIKINYDGSIDFGGNIRIGSTGEETLDSLLTIVAGLTEMWKIDDDGNLVTDKQVIIKNNLIVKGDTASGRTGGGAAIGVTGILVDGKQYTDNDSDGYIDLSEAFAGLSPTITSSMITEALGYVPANSALLGSLATKDSLVASDIPDLSGTYIPKVGGRASDLTIEGSGTVWLAFGNSSGTSFGSIGVNSSHEPKFWNGSGAFAIYHSGNFNPADYLPLSGGTISGSLQIGNDDNTSAVLLKTVRRGHYAAFRNTVNEMILSFGETSASTPEKMLVMGDSGLRYSADGGSAYNDILTSAGGTITSSSHIPLVVESTASNNYVAIRLKSASTQRTLGIKSDGTLFVTNVGGWDAEYPILHAGNYSDYALPLTGTTNTLSYTNNTILVLLNNGTGSSSGIRYDVGGSPKAWIGYDGSYGASLQSYASGKSLGIKDDGTPYYDSHTLIHSGNVGEYKSGDSDMVDGNHLMTEVTDWNAYQTSIFKSSQMNTANAPTTDFCYGLQMRFHRSVTNFYTDLVTAIYKDELYYRRHTEQGFGSWKQIAFTDQVLLLDGSNARSTKLTSSENLDDYQYGFYSYTNGNNPTNSFGDNTALFAFASNRGSDKWQIAFDGNGIPQNAGPRFGIRGNYANQGWTSWYRIATTESNVASATKLATARTIWGQSFDGTGNVSGALSGVTNINSALYINASGNVGIGTTDPQYKLDVAGQGRFTGAVTMASTLSVAGTLSANGSIEVYGSMPYIDFHFGNATDDYTSRIIEIASGNLAVYANWLPNTNNAKRLGNSDRRWSEIFGVNGNLSGTLDVGGASTFNGDVRINGNLVVTGDTASGGGNLRVDYNAMWALINKTSITQAEMDAVGFTTAVVNNLAIGAYHKIVGELGDYKYVYNYECRDLGGSIQLHIYFGDDNIDNCERFYFERSAGTWTLNFYEV